MLEINKNSLSGDFSPYLLQHKNNPVNWQTWTKEILDYAKNKKKPILLSIGYASCHWCHVMAHESFEDIETSKLMNKLFVNIKVDREERPDLDFIFQSSFQLFNQSSGGWPLTMFYLWGAHIFQKLQHMVYLVLKKFLKKLLMHTRIKGKILLNKKN